MRKNNTIFDVLGKQALVSIAIFLSIALPLFSYPSAAENPPSLPYVLHGAVSINGQPAPAGTLIESWSGGTMRGDTTTSVSGVYGDKPTNRLVVNGQTGEIITFRAKAPGMDTYASTEQTTVFSSGNTNQLNLQFTWDGQLPSNNAPVAGDLSVSTDEDTPKQITLAATDADGDSLNYYVVSQPAHGTISGNPPSVAYMPQNNYFGQDSFTYKAYDGTDYSNIATVSITVDSVNDAPVAGDRNIYTSKNVAAQATLLASDADGDTLSYQIVSFPLHGTASISGSTATYTPETDYVGSDSFTYKANDGNADSNTATVSVSVLASNTPPAVSGIPDISFEEGTAHTTAWSLDDYVYDTETPDSQIIWSYSGNTNVHIALNQDRTITFSAQPAWSGEETITFSASDGEYAESDTVAVTVTGGEPIPPDEPEPPALPYIVYGGIRIEGLPAPVGTTIVSKVGGEQRDTYVTIVAGYYGDKPYNRFIINGDATDEGKTVEFYVDGIRAQEEGIWASGTVKQINLTVYNDSPPVFPYILHGAVSINGQPAPAGTLIESWSGGTMRGDTTTSVSGVYGDKPTNKLVVNGQNGEIITFRAKAPGMDTYASTEQTTVFSSGESAEYNLQFTNQTAQPSQTWMRVSATVKVNGEDAPNGTILYAWVDDAVRGNATVENGTASLNISGNTGDDGKTVLFFAEMPALDTMSESNDTLILSYGAETEKNISFDAHNVELRDMSVPASIAKGSTLTATAVLKNTQNTNETLNVSFYLDNALLSSAEYSLSPYESKTISASWSAAVTGTHTLNFSSELQGDQNGGDNSVSKSTNVYAPSSSSGKKGGGGWSTVIVNPAPEKNQSDNSTSSSPSSDTGQDDAQQDTESGVTQHMPLSNTTDDGKSDETPSGFLFLNPGAATTIAVVLVAFVLILIGYSFISRP